MDCRRQHHKDLRMYVVFTIVIAIVIAIYIHLTDDINRF